MLDIDSKDLKIAKNILAENIPSIEVRVFGSRVKGTANKYSDLDLVVVGKDKLQFDKLCELQEIFQNSSMSIRVDVLDWHRIPANIKAVIEKDYEIIQKPTQLVFM